MRLSVCAGLAHKNGGRCKVPPGRRIMETVPRLSACRPPRITARRSKGGEPRRAYWGLSSGAANIDSKGG